MNEMSPDELCVDEVRAFLLKEVTSWTKRSACFLPKVKHLFDQYNVPVWEILK